MSEALIVRHGGTTSKDRMNFRIVTDAMPSNPTENILWITPHVTPTAYRVTKLDSWTGAAEGTIAIRYEAASGGASANIINIIREDKTTFMAAITSINQYTGGTWLPCSASLYNITTKTWTDIISELVLFDYGTDNTAVTGGWTKSYSDNIRVRDTDSSGYGGSGDSASSKKGIDLTYFKTLHTMASGTKSAPYCSNSFGVNDATIQITGGVSERTVDISKITGVKTINLSAFANAATVGGTQSASIECYKIWLT